MKNCGFEPDRDTFNTLISAYGRCGSEIDAAQMYDEMIKAGFSPCVTTYNALLNALARRGDWKAAESVVVDMRSKGFKPNETSYSLMINCYAKGANVKGIERIEREIYDGHIFPSWVLLRTLVLANFKCRALKGMERAFQKLQSNGYKPDLARAHAGGHKNSSEMTARGIRPCIFTYNTFITGYAGQGMFSEIDEVISYMTQNNCKPNELSYKIAVDGYCKARKYKEAMDFLSKIKEIDNSFDDQYVQRLASRIRGNLES
ncbi:pentatricopeptide repeat-containing protein [Prunus yedoensis var. nudiflora]|uniref:Pentatricopeptide repeat-containing protein n=1 Tax=Prunus yedoensis var. nudiflora TaxID=2094558 RepID=A0A314USI2_PRUYE|nr:pentatricopeptide repeat-containing protein [Prunus yedoensis var. nudiflora]